MKLLKNKFNLRRNLFILLSIPLIISISGCKKNKKDLETIIEENITTESAETNKIKADNIEEKKITEIKTEKNKTNKNNKKDEKKEKKRGRFDDIYIRKINWKPIIPEDFKIGELQDIKTENYRNKKIIKTIENFFKELKKGQIDYNLIHPGSKLLINESFEKYIEFEAIPDYVRIGKINIKNNSRASINVRFYLDDGITDGQIIIEYMPQNKDNKWVISDIQTDLMKLFDEYKKPEDKFQPSTYNFYNWE